MCVGKWGIYRQDIETSWLLMQPKKYKFLLIIFSRQNVKIERSKSNIYFIDYHLLYFFDIIFQNK